ncbi:MAG: hypothetical protein Q9205_004735 [Flavoplaca limonia]
MEDSYIVEWKDLSRWRPETVQDALGHFEGFESNASISLDKHQARTGSAPTMDFLKMKVLGVAANVHEDHGSLKHHAGTVRKDDADRAIREDEG